MPIETRGKSNVHMTACPFCEHEFGPKEKRSVHIRECPET